MAGTSPAMPCSRAMPNRIIGLNVELPGRLRWPNRQGASMSSSVTRGRQPSRTPRPSQGSGWRRPVIWSVLIVTTVWSIAAAAYFALRKDDTQPMAEMQAGYEKRIADLRTEFDRRLSLQQRVELLLDLLLVEQLLV
jgi:hypothetical protein